MTIVHLHVMVVRCYMFASCKKNIFILRDYFIVVVLHVFFTDVKKKILKELHATGKSDYIDKYKLIALPKDNQ